MTFVWAYSKDLAISGQPGKGGAVLVIETDVLRMINPRRGLNLNKMSNFRCTKMTFDHSPEIQGFRL